MRHSSASVNRSINNAPPDPQLPTGGFISILAHAKINLFLEVIGKRDDGYHNLVSVMQSLSLHDELTFCACEQREVFLEAEDAPSHFPLDDSNLIIKAAKFLMNAYQMKHGVKIRLKKRIPMGAGLGGGSSNCAATLHGLNQFFNLNIPLHRLMEIGKTFGADVPFCLMGGTALAQGIGEKLTPLPPHPHCYVVLACPGIHVSTKEIFSRLQLNKTNHCYHSAVTAIKKGQLETIASSFYNGFTPVTSNIHPEIAELITHLKHLGALNASMTGTGSTVFGYFENENDAKMACDRLDTQTFLTTIQRGL